MAVQVIGRANEMAVTWPRGNGKWSSEISEKEKGCAVRDPFFRLGRLGCSFVEGLEAFVIIFRLIILSQGMHLIYPGLDS